VFIVSLLYFFC